MRKRSVLNILIRIVWIQINEFKCQSRKHMTSDEKIMSMNCMFIHVWYILIGMTRRIFREKSKLRHQFKSVNCFSWFFLLWFCLYQNITFFMTSFRMDEDIEIDNAIDTSINLPLIGEICLSSQSRGVNSLDHGLLIQTITENRKYAFNYY